MDAILISANPDLVRVDDAIRHLAEHDQLYWEVGFRIKKDQFSFPLWAFIHVCGEQVEYRATISDILPFSPGHYEDKELAELVKPEVWMQEWKQNFKDARSRPWKNALVMTEIQPFSCDTYSLIKYDGTRVVRPPEGYIRLHPPSHSAQTSEAAATDVQTHVARISIAERNLEDFLVQQLEAIEPGLRLETRQMSTPAGRLDLLCRDTNNDYVVVELKRNQGTDQVVGQILRYMGWLRETHPSDNIRGIVVVGRKDQALTYAASAVPNLQVKEFKVELW